MSRPPHQAVWFQGGVGDPGTKAKRRPALLLRLAESSLRSGAGTAHPTHPSQSGPGPAIRITAHADPPRHQALQAHLDADRLSGRDDDWEGALDLDGKGPEPNAGRCGTRQRRGCALLRGRVGGLAAADGAEPQECDLGPSAAHHPGAEPEPILASAPLLEPGEAETPSLPLAVLWRGRVVQRPVRW